MFVLHIADERYICEGDTYTISCGAGESVDILYATYGRSSSSLCPYHNPAAMTNTNCSSIVDILSIVDGICNSSLNVSSCTLTPTNNLFEGDPCGGTYKYLTVGFQCSEIGQLNVLVLTDMINTCRHYVHRALRKCVLGICRQRKPRSACVSAQCDQDLRCPLTESLCTMEYINGEQMPE